jgi:hypothetical protein
MRQRIVSSLLLSLWLVLVGVELAEELGLFDFDDPGLARTMDGIVDSFGQSTPVDDPQHSLKSIFPIVSFVMNDAYFPEVSIFQTLVQQPALIVKPSFRIFKLEQVFLI